MIEEKDNVLVVNGNKWVNVLIFLVCTQWFYRIVNISCHAFLSFWFCLILEVYKVMSNANHGLKSLCFQTVSLLYYSCELNYFCGLVDP